MSHYLGIDIGTFESKGVIVDGLGRIEASASKPHKMLVPRAGWAEHRPKLDWWADLSFICRKMLADSRIEPNSIRAVAVSAIGPCMLPVDERGKALSNAVLYGVDTRAAREIVELNEAIGSSRILERCGNSLTSQSVGPKILWLKRHRPELFARAAKIVTSTSYLVQKLTGACVVDHYSAAGFSPLYAIGEAGWSAELSRGVIETERLPGVRWSTEIAGTVTAKAARETGLARGTPVTVGTIDAAAEAISVGVTRPGDMMLMYGSTIFAILLTNARLQDGRLWYAPWLFPGQHASMAGLATSGTLTHWFRDQVARDLDPQLAFETLAREAEASPPGARGLVVLPYFSGERTPIHDVHAKGLIFGMNLTHGRGDLYRAFIEGIAFSTNHILDTYRELREPPRRLLAVGGGTRNPVWTTATSDVVGMAQTICRQTIGASYGDAFLAALAVGDVSRDDILDWNPQARRVAPRKNYRGVYTAQYRIFRQLYERTRDLMADLG